MIEHSSHRRAFLRWLAASPLLAAAGLGSEWFTELLSAPISAQEQNSYVIKTVREALNVFDFRTAAQAKLSVPHFVEFDEGVFNEETQIADRAAHARYQLRVRRLLGVTKVDQSVPLFGRTWDSPLYLCPAGRLRAIHPDGNLAIAPAANRKRTLEIMSGTQDLEKVNALRGEPVWICGGQPSAETIKRLEAVGTPVYVWTVDTVGGGNQIGARAVQRAGVPDLERKNDPRCNSCHDSEGRITLSDPMDKVIGALGALRRAGHLYLGGRPARTRHDEDAPRVEGRRRAGGRSTRRQARRGRHHGLHPCRTRGCERPRFTRMAAGGRGGRRRQDHDLSRQRHPTQAPVTMRRSPA
jgi:hypothetical protein